MVMRSLLLLQLGALVVVLGLCLWNHFLLALLISFLTLLFFVAVIIWLYIRYNHLPAVCEKRNIAHLVLKFEKNLHVEELRIQDAVRERIQLARAEKQEIRKALRVLQTNFIKAGLGNASIEHADIPGVEPKRKEQLTKEGILNAAQVSTKIAQLPGFGEAQCQALLDWRTSVVATLESTKPSALPPEQLDSIKKKYEELHDKNNAAERKAISSQQILEHELMSFRPQLRALASITFLGYLRRSLASRGIVAALVALILVVTQIVSSVSVTLAFAAGK